MTKEVKIKNIIIGGGHKIAIQSMTNTDTKNIKLTVEQILRLQNLGADIVRISIPDFQSADSLKLIIPEVSIPIVADIHFDYKLALASIENGVHKIRINPSNFPKSGLKEVVNLAKERDIAIRVGVNQGSFKLANITPKMLANLALETTKQIEDLGFDNLILAVKSSSVRTTIEAYRALSQLTNYPLHIGLTESGTPNMGIVKSSIAIGSLLLDGIGDTVRVSLTAPPEQEIIVAQRILQSIGLINNRPEIVSCPTCARTNINVEEIANKIENLNLAINSRLKIAVMGCFVNGIGESKDANVGVAGGKEESLLFCDQNIVKKVKNADIITELTNLILEYQKSRGTKNE